MSKAPKTAVIEEIVLKRRILGDSPAVHDLIKLIKRVAATNTNILVIGESGTGKELVARAIHELGPLRTKPFIPVNCGAIPETLIESEMFGHKRGSFTGAVGEKMGLFEAASGGTLFLDEVGELPLSMQVKLLRAIQERSIRKVGGTEDVKVDARIIAATNRDLEAAVAKGTFREDLYYRLNVILIRTPPLRERGSDVRLLCEASLKRFSDKYSKGITEFDPAAMAALEAYPWPGNVRELENVIERAITLENGTTIGVASLPPAVASAATAGTASAVPSIALPSAGFENGGVKLDEILDQVERHYVTRALARAQGDEKRAAELLSVTLKALKERAKKLGL